MGLMRKAAARQKENAHSDHDTAIPITHTPPDSNAFAPIMTSTIVPTTTNIKKPGESHSMFAEPDRPSGARLAHCQCGSVIRTTCTASLNIVICATRDISCLNV
jgi:hypothetical protein